MKIEQLTGHEIEKRSIKDLGLSIESNFQTPEGLAALIRRTAGFLCPCTHRTLTETIFQILEGLQSTPPDELRKRIDDGIESLEAYGDLVEGVETDCGKRRLLYFSVPAFVWRDSGIIFLIGILRDRLTVLPPELEAKIQYIGHTRRLPANCDDGLRNYLLEFGLYELSQEDWLKTPKECSAEEHINLFNQIVTQAGNAGDIEGLQILDTNTPVRFYPKRWMTPKRQTGRFVGRRNQSYGAPLWCYVELEDGHPVRFTDLPYKGSIWRGCDDAWRLQAAIDAVAGHPQQYRIRPAGDQNVIDLFSPFPSWFARRWDIVGQKIPSEQCLLSYRFAKSEIQAEVEFAKRMLWMDIFK